MRRWSEWQEAENKTQLRQWEPILLAWSDYVEPESINNNIMTETYFNILIHFYERRMFDLK